MYVIWWMQFHAIGSVRTKNWNEGETQSINVRRGLSRTNKSAAHELVYRLRDRKLGEL